MSPTRAFANLRAYLEWWADNRTATVCCQTATLEEIRARPELFDCRRCERAARFDDLWTVNRRAIDIYHRLCGRAVRDAGAAGWLLQVLTEGWSRYDVLDLLARLDVIAEILDPPPMRPAGA